MIGIPPLGARVQVWPAPGRKVQLGERTLDSGGRWMRAAGESVVWSAYHLEQLRAGDIMLHAPACKKHDFKDRDLCRLCGRDMKSAQEYDVRVSEAEKRLTPAGKAGLPKGKE